MISTRITELFKIQHPIMLAGMNWITEPRIVSAVCNADQDFSGRVTGADLAVLKKDLGRVTTCPCGQ